MKYYSDEFKNNIVKLYHNENRSKKSLANEYGVHPTTISHWIKRAKLVELPVSFAHKTRSSLVEILSNRVHTFILSPPFRNLVVDKLSLLYYSEGLKYICDMFKFIITIPK
uniref:transposase n=1 Tax=Lentilactobacillus hilgardii TaxID=1588 RepID=UPI00403F26A0